jgi:hypothetical protein
MTTENNVFRSAGVPSAMAGAEGLDEYSSYISLLEEGTRPIFPL